MALSRPISVFLFAISFGQSWRIALAAMGAQPNPSASLNYSAKCEA